MSLRLRQKIKINPRQILFTILLSLKISDTGYDPKTDPLEKEIVLEIRRVPLKGISDHREEGEDNWQGFGKKGRGKGCLKNKHI